MHVEALLPLAVVETVTRPGTGQPGRGFLLLLIAFTIASTLV